MASTYERDVWRVWGEPLAARHLHHPSVEQEEVSAPDARTLREMSPEVEPLTQSARCQWCHRDVVSFVGEPFMVQVSHRPDHIRQGTRDRVCLDCYAAFIRFIWGRQAA